MMDASKKDFEAMLSELEKIVEALNSEEASLEASLTLFEKGIKLSKECSAILENAKQRIINLTDAESEEEEND